jgi:hypothetical protein
MKIDTDKIALWYILIMFFILYLVVGCGGDYWIIKWFY